MPKSNSLQAPGSFLAQTLEKYNLTPFRLSKDIRLSQSAVRLLVLGKNRITVPVALRLAKYFNTTPELWLTMQMKWEIANTENDKELVKIISGIPLAQKGPALKKDAAKSSTSGGTSSAVSAKKPKTAGKTAAAGKVKKPAAAKKAAEPKKQAPAKKAVKKTAGE